MTLSLYFFSLHTGFTERTSKVSGVVSVAGSSHVADTKIIFARMPTETHESQSAARAHSSEHHARPQRTGQVELHQAVAIIEHGCHPFKVPSRNEVPRQVQDLLW